MSIIRSKQIQTAMGQEMHATARHATIRYASQERIQQTAAMTVAAFQDKHVSITTAQANLLHAFWTQTAMIMLCAHGMCATTGILQLLFAGILNLQNAVKTTATGAVHTAAMGIMT